MYLIWIIISKQQVRPARLVSKDANLISQKEWVQLTYSLLEHLTEKYTWHAFSSSLEISYILSF